MSRKRLSRVATNVRLAISKAHELSVRLLPTKPLTLIERVILKKHWLLSNEILFRILENPNHDRTNAADALAVITKRNLVATDQLRVTRLLASSNREADESPESSEFVHRPKVIRPVPSFGDRAMGSPVYALNVVVPVAEESWWITDRADYFRDVARVAKVTFACALTNNIEVNLIRAEFQGTPNIEVVDLPGANLPDRLSAALSSVTSDYVLFHPHDETYSCQGISSALEVAMNEPNTAVNGSTYSLTYARKSLCLGQMYKYESSLRAATMLTFSTEIVRHFSPYKQKFFNAIVPKEVFQTCVTLWQQWTDDVILGEIIFEVVGVSALNFRRLETPIRLRNSLARSSWNRTQWTIGALQASPSYGSQVIKPFLSWLYANGFPELESRAGGFVRALSGTISNMHDFEETECERALQGAFRAYGTRDDRQDVNWLRLEADQLPEEVFADPQLGDALERYSRFLNIVLT